jgi:hypothetical protein
MGEVEPMMQTTASAVPEMVPERIKERRGPGQLAESKDRESAMWRAMRFLNTAGQD